MPRPKPKPGSDTIANCTARKDSQGTWRLKFRYFPLNGDSPRQRTGVGDTKGACLADCQRILAELKSIDGIDGVDANGGWTETSNVGEFIDQVVIPAIERDGRIRENSRSRYLTVIKLAVGECGGGRGGYRHDPKDHTKAIGRFMLTDITKHRKAFVRLEDCITEVAALHGAETARQMHHVLGKYLIGQLVREGVIARHESPLAGMSIDYGKVKTVSRPSGGHALSSHDYDRVLNYLLAVDPEEGVTAPKRGVYTLADRVRQRASIIDLTLLQATTGLRITETCTLEPHEVRDNIEGGINIYIPEAKAKDHRERTVTILDDRVAERIRARRNAARIAGQRYIIPSPAKPTSDVPWDKSNRDKVARALYKEMAEVLDLPIMSTEFRSHGWRTTLNMLHYDLPDHIRSSWFGHGVDVNHANYTDNTVDLSSMVKSAPPSPPQSSVT
jgi:hypothetical protein